MKKTVVFLLFFLLLAVVSISGTGNKAFAGNNYPSPSPEVAVLVCSVTPSLTNTFSVTAFSNSTQPQNKVTIGIGDDCSADLVALENGGLQIINVQALNTSPSVAYTLVNGIMRVGPSVY